jgi:hypothetical protein
LATAEGVQLSEDLFDRSLDEPLAGKCGASAKIETLARSELRRGERLLWVGQPRPKLFARQARGAVILGLVWTAFSTVFFTVAVSGMLSGSVRSVYDPIAFLPPLLVLLGLAVLSTPFWMRRQAKRTYYALTDRRAILWEPAYFKAVEVRSYGAEALTGVYRVEYPGGGDLVLVEDHVIRPDNEGTRISTTKHGFMGIENVREVEELLRRMVLRTDG